MARLPQPGADSGTWGDILNEYLSTAHKADGSLKDGVVGATALATNAVTVASIADGTITEAKLATAVQTKLNAASTTDPTLGGDLAGTASNAQIAAGVVTATEMATNAVTTVKIADGAVTSTKLDTATSALIASKADQSTTYTKTETDSLLASKSSTSHSHALDNLSDVTAAGATNGQSLVYNAGTWGPADVGTGGTVVDATNAVKGVVQLSGDFGGTAASPVVTGLRGVPVSSTAPSSGQVLQYNGSSAVWSTAGGGGVGDNVIQKTTNYVAQAGDFILLDMSAGAITITTPTPANGARFSVKKTDASNFNVTVSGANIDGYMISWSFPTTDRGISQDFISDGTNWYLC